MVADKGKKSKVAERGEEQDSDHVDGELVMSIEKLQEIQDELEKINEEASDKVLEVEQKYNEFRRPVYIRRNGIIQSIPDFWLTAFLSHPALSDLLTEEDQKIFKYLVSLDVEDCKDVKSGYSIVFNFSPNPYFEDTKLVKTYSFTEEGTTNITGTTIKWKEGMDIANGNGHEKKGSKRPLTEESFFSWFGETELKNFSDGVTDEVIIHGYVGKTDYFGVWTIRNLSNQFFFYASVINGILRQPGLDVAEIIKEDLWPNPLKYFNNEADEEDFDGDEDDEEKGSEDDEDGDQDDDEEEDDEDDS